MFRAFVFASGRAACEAITMALSISMSSGRESVVGGRMRLQHTRQTLPAYRAPTHNVARENFSPQLAAATYAAAAATRVLLANNLAAPA